MTNRIRSERPQAPLAHGYQLMFCDAPNCGLHVIAVDKDNNPICEVVMSAEGTKTLVEICQGELYDKATRRV